MVDAAARGMYELTSTFRLMHIPFDLLPQAVQGEMHRMAEAALRAGLAAAPMPES
jgi:hypothetical protein